MPANNALIVSDINFDSIKDNLQTFLSNQTELGDYDYQSSTMQTIINLLAYNTYMNSYYLNMASNEMFLDSAQIRSNIVSRAKMLNYVPRSAQGPEATVQVIVTPTDTPASISLDKNTKFQSTVDGIKYIFVNTESKTINANASGVYSTNISLIEGRPFTFQYTVSSVDPVRYVVPADNVDTRSLAIKIQETSANSNITTYTNATNLVDITGTSTAYFLHENEEGRFEITFGDGVIGKALNDGNVVNIDYRVCNGASTNGANTFVAVDSISGYSNISVNHVSRATGGGDKESVQSIKFSAPKDYQAQNRAVTSKDYEAVIKNNFADIQAVSVWGGEDNTPPVYGKVYIAVKPVSGTLIPEDRKSTIVDFLNKKNILTIDPVIVDPTYLYVKPTITVKYNPDLTSLSSGEIATAVKNKILNYETNTLGIFGRDFIGSQLMADISSASESISSVQDELMIEKEFKPNTTTSTTYSIAFNNPIYNPHPGHKYAISSSKFTYEGNNTSYFDDDGNGVIKIYTLTASGTRSYSNNNAGSINYLTGLVTLDNLLITEFDGSAVKIIADPLQEDIDSVRNQLLLIKDASVSVFDSKLKSTVATLSSIATEGASSTIPETGVITTVY